MIDTLLGHTEEVAYVNFSSSTKYIASCSSKGNILIWDIDGNLIKTVNNDSLANEILFLHGDENFLLCDNTKVLKLYSLKNNIVQKISGHQAAVSSISLSKNGYLFLTGSTDGEVKLWTIDGKCLRTFQGTVDRNNKSSGINGIYKVYFSSNEKYIITYGGEGVKIWETEGKLLRTYNYIKLCGFDSAKNSILEYRVETNIYINSWNLEGKLKNKIELINTENVTKYEILSFDYSHIHGYFAISIGHYIGFNNRINIWDNNGNVISDIKTHSIVPFSLKYSPNNEFIVVGYGNGTIKIFDLNLLYFGRALPTQLDTVYSVDISSDSKNILTTCGDGKTSLWSSSGNLISEYKDNKSHSELPCASFSSNGNFIAGGYDLNCITIWNSNLTFSFKITDIAKSDFKNPLITSTCFTPDDKYLVASTYNPLWFGGNVIKIWDINGKVKKHLKKKSKVFIVLIFHLMAK